MKFYWLCNTEDTSIFYFLLSTCFWVYIYKDNSAHSTCNMPLQTSTLALLWTDREDLRQTNARGTYMHINRTNHDGSCSSISASGRSPCRRMPHTGISHHWQQEPLCTRFCHWCHIHYSTASRTVLWAIRRNISAHSQSQMLLEPTSCSTGLRRRCPFAGLLLGLEQPEGAPTTVVIKNKLIIRSVSIYKPLQHLH